MVLSGRVRFVAAIVVAGLVPPAPLPAQHAAARDKAFWQSLAARKFAVPAGESAPQLARELSVLLASPDPELRDDIAYTGLVALIYRQRAVPAGVTRELAAQWMQNLTDRIAERDTDAVLKRSFSALSLGIVAALDNEAPFLTREEFDRLLTAAVAYLAAETDVRGFDPVKGWVHATAHTADLVKFLARSRHLQAAQQSAVLKAIGARMARARSVFTHGEDERLARAVLSIAARADLDAATFEGWLSTLRPARDREAPTAARLAADQNVKNLVVSLHAVLSTDPRDTPLLQRVRAAVLGLLRTFHGVA
jgi:hypothetical protein